jgi:parvulin-like peptidyl-prolyl isomerase
MSLNSLRKLFHSRGLGLVILSIVTIAMLVTAYTGIGAILNRTGKTAMKQGSQTNPAVQTVATVDGIGITAQEFEQAYEQTKQRFEMYSQGQPSSVFQAGQVRGQALQELISQTEEVHIAEQAGVTVDSSDLDKARQQQVAPLIKELNLSATASIDDINQALQANGSSQTVDQMFPDSLLRKQVILQKYQDLIKRLAQPTDAAVTQYYRSVHVRHILISNKSRPDAQAKALAELVTSKVINGGDFAALAKQYSDDPGSKNKGGDDGFITQQTPYVPEFLKAALGLNAGQTTPEPVLSSQYGYFIIQALAVKENMPADYAKNKAKYQQIVAQALQGQMEQAAYAAEQKSAKVVVTDPLLKAYYTMYQPGAQSNPSIEADLRLALATADYTTKGEIYCQLAQIYQSKNDVKDEIDALKNSLSSVEDAQIRLMLGDAYAKLGDKQDAISQYTNAGADAYNDPGTHIQLQQDYKKLGATKEAAAEMDWMKQYAARTKTAKGAGPGGIPGGVPITIPAGRGK